MNHNTNQYGEHIRLITRKITYTGILLAIIVVLSTVEHSLPPLPFLPPNFKLGLSNIVIMYSLFFIGSKETFALLFMKSLFVLFTRGSVAGILSLSGGIFSLCAIIFIKYLSRNQASLLMLSLSGAVFHNAGQILTASFILDSKAMLYYLPITLLFGIIMGYITGHILKSLMPYFNRIFLNKGGAFKGRW